MSNSGQNVQSVNGEMSEARKRSLANLRPWRERPPNSGPKKGNISIVKGLKESLRANPREVTQIIEAWKRHAKKGNPKLFEMLVDRLDGKLIDKQQITHEMQLATVPDAQLEARIEAKLAAIMGRVALPAVDNPVDNSSGHGEKIIDVDEIED